MHQAWHAFTQTVAAYLSRLVRMVCLVVIFIPAPGVSAAPLQNAEVFFRPGEQVTIESGSISYYRSAELYVAENGVTIRYGDNTLHADRVVLDRKRKIFIATGNVHLTDLRSELRSDRIVAHFDDRTGVVFGGQMFIKESGYRFAGARIEKLSDDEYVVENGSFTTCNCGPGEAPSWYVSAGKIRVRLGGYAQVRSALFYVKGVPVLYLPFGFFPVKTEREFGLLLPTLQYSKINGLEVHQGLFVPIGDSADATLWADYYSAKGYGASGELRYAGSRGSYGRTNLSYIHQSLLDRNAPDFNLQRYTLDSTNRHNFSPFEALVASIHTVSDRRFNADYGLTLEEKTRQYAPSELSYIHSGKHGSVLGLAEVQVRLGPSNLPVANRFPHMEATLWPQKLTSWGPLVSLRLAGDHFVRKPADSTLLDINAYRTIGDRFDMAARAEQPFVIGPALVVPFAVARETAYRLGSRSTHRELAMLGSRAEVPWERLYHYGEPATRPPGRLYHRITPTARHLWVPMVNQATHPEFDEIDRIAPRNLVEYGLDNRVFWQAGARTAPGSAELGIFQHYAFRTTATVAFSPLLLRGRLHWPEWAELSIDQYVDPAQRKGAFYAGVYRAETILPQHTTLTLEYHSFANYVVNDRTRVLVDDFIDASYRRYSGFGTPGPWASREVWGSLQRTFFDRLTTGYTTRYSLDAKLFLESTYFISYQSACRCWSLASTVIQRPNQDLVFNLTISLTGIGSIGNR